MKNIFKKILISFFILLYIAVGLVSTYHAVIFFSLANQTWLAIILAVAFELGQAATLLALITSKTAKSHFLPWLLMIILTTVQIIGNVYASYQYLSLFNLENIKFFQESVLFNINNSNIQIYKIIIVWIIGALLPIITLGITSLIMEDLIIEDKKNSNQIKTSNVKRKPKTQMRVKRINKKNIKNG